MAERRPLVLLEGRIQELPVDDTLPGAGGTDDGKHRYWRISEAYTVQQPGVNFIHGEIQWRDDGGVKIPATITGSTPVLGAYAIANSNDDNLNSYGILAGGGPHYILYDFGADVAPTSIAFRCDSGEWAAQQCKTFKFGYSDDGITWTTLPTIYETPAQTVATWNAVELPTNKSTVLLAELADVDVTDRQDAQVLTYDEDLGLWVPRTPSGGGSGGGIEDAPADDKIYGRINNAWAEIVGGGGSTDPGAAAHSFWRLRLPIGGGWYAYSIGEIQMRSVAGGIDQCIGGTPFANASGSGLGPERAFDDNANTDWESPVFGVNQQTATQEYTIGYQFPSPVKVTELVLTTRQGTSGEALQLPLKASIEYSDDGVIYEQFFDYEIDQPANNASVIIGAPTPAAEGQRSFSSYAVIGNGVASNWGGYTGNDGTAIPGYSLTFTLAKAGRFLITINFAYQGQHGVRVKPRRNGVQMMPGILNGGWDFQTNVLYESNTGWGFERTFMVDLPAGTHLIDVAYNAMNSTSEHILGQGFITAREV
jgi:hypothetical protein